MKFYNGGKSYSGFYRNKIVKFKLNAIYCGYYYTRFFENGIRVIVKMLAIMINMGISIFV